MLFNFNKDKNKHQRRLADQMGPVFSFLSADMRVKGTLDGKNSLNIAGLMEGDIQSDKLVWILKGGKVEGNIQAGGVIVEGEVYGNIAAKEKTELRSGAKVVGDIACRKLSVAEDAFFQGKIKMVDSGEEPYTFVAKRKDKNEKASF